MIFKILLLLRFRVNANRKIFNARTSNWIFSTTDRNIAKASYLKGHHILIINTVQFVCLYVPRKKAGNSVWHNLSVLCLKASVHSPIK